MPGALRADDKRRRLDNAQGFVKPGGPRGILAPPFVVCIRLVHRLPSLPRNRGSHPNIEVGYAPESSQKMRHAPVFIGMPSTGQIIVPMRDMLLFTIDMLLFMRDINL